MKKQLATTAAPGAIGPYSQAIDLGSFVYVSGQIPVNPATGTMPEGIKAQTAQSSLFADMNEVYGSRFTAPYPARSAVAVKELPKQALVEIEVIAVR